MSGNRLLEAGAEQTFGQIYQEYFQELFQYFYRRSGNANDAEDMVQRVFIKFATSYALNRYEERGQLRSYFYKVAHNMLVNYYRDTSRRSKLMGNLDGDSEHSDNLAAPEERVVNECWPSDEFIQLASYVRSELKPIEFQILLWKCGFNQSASLALHQLLDGVIDGEQYRQRVIETGIAGDDKPLSDRHIQELLELSSVSAAKAQAHRVRQKAQRSVRRRQCGQVLTEA